jgi:hypothetical protein
LIIKRALLDNLRLVIIFLVFVNVLLFLVMQFFVRDITVAIESFFILLSKHLIKAFAVLEVADIIYIKVHFFWIGKLQNLG